MVEMGSHPTKRFLFNHTTPFSTKGLEKSLCDFTETILVQCENPVRFSSRGSGRSCFTLRVGAEGTGLWHRGTALRQHGPVPRRTSPSTTAGAEPGSAERTQPDPILTLKEVSNGK